MKELQWETPVLIDLNSKPAHGDCFSGSGDSDNCISVGLSAGLSCQDGTSGAVTCSGGIYFLT